MEDVMDKRVRACVSVSWTSVRLQRRKGAPRLWRHVLVCECVHVSLFSNKDKSTLNKSTSHYAEALIHHCSNASCITDIPLAILAFPFSPTTPSSSLPLIVTTNRSVFKCNRARLALKQSRTRLIHFPSSSVCLLVPHTAD